MFAKILLDFDVDNPQPKPQESLHLGFEKHDRIRKYISCQNPDFTIIIGQDIFILSY